MAINKEERDMSDLHSRRAFMAQGLGFVGAGSLLQNAINAQLTPDPTSLAGDRILVIIQLSGGHDAMSALVPYGHDAYGRVRKATRITEKEVLKLNNEVGLHPNLKGFKELHERGAFAAVPGTGYPKPTYSHFKAMDIWHMADRRGRAVTRGWLGRYFDAAFPKNLDPQLSLAVGSGKTPLAIVGGAHPGLCFSRPESFTYTGAGRSKERVKLYGQMNASAKNSAASNLDFVTQTAANANACSAEIRRLARAHKPKATYPSTSIGRALRTVGAMVAGDASTRVYYVKQGGYDTHSGQRTRHDRLMAELDAAVMAFQQDLDAQGNAKKVMSMAFSEFGRRVKENGSEGTDHGAAGSMFLIGEGVKAGVHGKHPSLTELQGGGGGSLVHTVDFRSVYATVLEKWLKTPSEKILGKQYPLLTCI